MGVDLKSVIADSHDIETLAEIDIDFTAEASKEVTIAIGATTREVLRGRLWIDTTPAAPPFSEFATVTFYSRAAKHGEDVLPRFEPALLVYTELEVATTGADANITPDDQTDFSPSDLAMILDPGDDELVRLATIADTMVAEDTVGAHAINWGLVRVLEFSGFSLANLEGATDVYLTVAFDAVQTVSLKLELVMRR